MKKLIILSLVVFLSHTALGQIERPISKGNFLTGGSITFDHENAKESGPVVMGNEQILTRSTNTLLTNLHVGHYFVNNLAIGIVTKITAINQKETVNLDPDYSYKAKTYFIDLGPFVRYSTNVGLFFEGTTSIGLNRHSSSSKSKWRDYSFSLGTGYSFFVNRVLAIEPSIIYNYSHTPQNDFSGNTTINGLTLALGLQVYFNLKQE